MSYKTKTIGINTSGNKYIEEFENNEIKISNLFLVTSTITIFVSILWSKLDYTIVWFLLCLLSIVTFGISLVFRRLEEDDSRR